MSAKPADYLMQMPTLVRMATETLKKLGIPSTLSADEKADALLSQHRDELVRRGYAPTKKQLAVAFENAKWLT